MTPPKVSPWARVAFSMLAIASAAAGSAHGRSESHSLWEIHCPSLDLVMTIPSIEAQRLRSDGGPPDDEEMGTP